MNYVCHRIDDSGIIKVADFGLSEDIYACNYFRQLKGSDNNSGSSTVKLPVKWMALESLHDGLFSEKSDVVSKHLLLQITCNEYQFVNFIFIYSGLMVCCVGKCSVLVRYHILVWIQ